MARRHSVWTQNRGVGSLADFKIRIPSQPDWGGTHEAIGSPRRPSRSAFRAAVSPHVPGLRSRSLLAALSLAALGALATACAGASAGRLADRPIRIVAEGRIPVRTAAGAGVVPLYVSRDWSAPRPEVTRAIVLLHGTLGRDVFVRMATELAGSREWSRDTILLAPQFLTDLDVASHRLPDDVLQWRLGSLGSGGDAASPAKISTFEALDAIVTRLADRARFPALARIVVAGHSGGGQMAHRYAIVGRGHDIATRVGIPVRYVIANPSSFLYFSDERPTPDGKFRPLDAASCPDFNRWRYGLRGAPAYVRGVRAAEREDAYARRDVVYLLGTADNDPSHFELDKSCMGEAQGPNRHARGVAYVRYLRERHPQNLNHRQWDVPAIGHDGDRMLTSPCGLAALYGGAPLPERCPRSGQVGGP